MKYLSSKKEAHRRSLVIELFKKIEEYSNNPPKDPLEEHEHTEATLSKIIELEKEITISLPRRENKWKDFIRWCSEHGIPMDKFDIRKVDENEYGLFTNTPIKQDDVIVQIPRTLFISNETAQADSNLDVFVGDIFCTRIPNLILAFHLMAEYRKPDSFWAPYLQTLPDTYATLPYLSHQEILQLRGSPLLEEVVKIKRNVARQYAYFAMKLGVSSPKKQSPFGNFTYQYFRWALSTVMTRQNSIPCRADSEQRTLALIPLWDMCNHRDGILCTDFDTNSDTLVFYSMRDLKQGDEIFNYYGNRNNADFFLNNGFVHDNPLIDSVRIKIGLSTADSLYPLKEALCKKLNLSTQNVFELADKSQPLNAQLLAFIRVFLLEKEQLEKWISSEKSSDLFDRECKELIHLDDKVAQFLSMRCSLLLRKYVPVDRFLNVNIEKLINAEKRILQSHVAI